MTLVDIVAPELAERDATTLHARGLRTLLAQDGHRVRLVVERPTPTADDVVLIDGWKADADVTILQHAIGSRAAHEIVRRRVPVVVNYHNVTPPEFVEPWEPEQLAGLRWGRDQLWQLAPLTTRGIAVSDYNARDLREVGMAVVEVAPVLFDRAAMPPSGWTPSGSGSGLSGGGGSGLSSPATLLFVGRLAPNKCQQDLVGVLAVLVGMGVDAELVLVGGSSSAGFESALRGLVSGLGLEGRVVFAGSVSEAELARWYSVADVFVCLSEHEGFGVPLVEAMAAGVPVVAFGAAAVPETVGSAGVVLGDKSPVVVAEAVLRVVSDEGLRRGLVAAGLARVVELGPEVAGARMREVLAPVLAEAGP